MHLSTLKGLSFLGLAGLAASAPLAKRTFNVGTLSTSPPSGELGVAQFGQMSQVNLQVNDVNILQFALMLEVEQTLFYQQAFSQFSVQDMLSVGLSQSEIIELQNAAFIEQTHVDTIVTVLQSLNVQPLAQPQFFFHFSSPVDFITQLAVQEVVGTGAYLGAAPLVQSKDLLSAAASIMAVEARQSSFVNSVLGINAFSSAFETPLSIEQVVSIVTPFIASVPSGTVLEALGFNTQAFAVPPIQVSAFEQVSIKATFLFTYVGGGQIVPPSGVNQLFCAYSVGSNTFYTQFTPGTGCGVSSDIIVGSVVFVQITVEQSISISSQLSAGQFITIVD